MGVEEVEVVHDPSRIMEGNTFPEPIKGPVPFMVTDSVVTVKAVKKLTAEEARDNEHEYVRERKLAKRKPRKAAK